MPPRKAHDSTLIPVRELRRRRRMAREAAESAAELVARRYRPQGVPMLEKGAGDFVTRVDLAAEDLLRRRLEEAVPEDGILGEERPPVRVDAPFVWVLDPIDGTSNFGRGLPQFAVSVACLHKGVPVAAAVHCFPERATFHAARGLGAARGRVRLAIPARRLGASSIVGAQWHRDTSDPAFLRHLTATGTRVRNFGCTVTQLCDVASGRLDANVQEQGLPWDFAAAALIVMECGGRFSGWDGAPIFPLDPAEPRHQASVAAHPDVHRQLVRSLATVT